jgi:hypothetical protein
VKRLRMWLTIRLLKLGYRLFERMSHDERLDVHLRVHHPSLFSKEMGSVRDKMRQLVSTERSTRTVIDVPDEMKIGTGDLVRQDELRVKN